VITQITPEGQNLSGLKCWYQKLSYNMLQLLITNKILIRMHFQSQKHKNNHKLKLKKHIY